MKKKIITHKYIYFLFNLECVVAKFRVRKNDFVALKWGESEIK